MLLVGTVVAACSPFVAGSGDGDGGAGEDASAADALGTPGDAASDRAAAADSADASAKDARQALDAGFCSGAAGIIQCFDFDESDPAVGLALTQPGGTVSFETTFAGGSAPKAMVIEAKTAGGTAVATASQVDFTAYKNKTVIVELRFDVGAMPTATEYIARLNDVHSFISVEPAGIRCGAGAPAAMLLPGAHKLSVTMHVSAAGMVNSIACTVDATPAQTSITPASTSLVLELGNVNSGSGNFRVAYDDVIVRVQ